MTASRAIAIRSLIVALGVTAMVLGFAMNARAQSQLGAVAPDGTTNSACINCSFLQFAENGSPTYRASEQSVITAFAFREGSTFGVNNYVSLQVWRPVGPVEHQLVAESAPLTMVGTVNWLRSGFVRMSMRAGDVIGLRINSQGGDTSPNFPAPAGNFIGAIMGDPSAGQVFSPVSLNSFRLNLLATIEPDADGDGFGDETQDLCPGNPSAGDSACSGSLVGTAMTSVANGSAPAGGGGSLFVAASIPNENAVSPIDGVIVRWRFKATGFAGAHRMRVVRRSNSFDLQILRSSNAIESPGIGGRIVRSGEVRVPISAGDSVGLQAPAGTEVAFSTWPGLSATIINGDLADGAFASGGAWPESSPMVSADVEPDADGDGFGDITQDQCPGNSAVTGVCPPTLSAVKTSNSKFRVNPKGAVISKAKRGTTLSYSLGGGAAVVKVTVERVDRGRRSGKKCVKQSKRNKRRKSCNRFVKVHDFSRSAAVGANAIAYSGRYKLKGRNRALKPGRYRFSLVAANASGNVSAVSKTFRVVKR